MRVTPIVRLCAVRGISWQWSVENLVDADSNPLDLSGFGLLMRVRRSVGVPTSIIELSTDNGRLAHPAAGIVVGDVPAAAMLAFPDVVRAVEYQQSLIAISGDDSVQVWRGTLLVSIDATRPWSET